MAKRHLGSNPRVPLLGESRFHAPRGQRYFQSMLKTVLACASCLLNACAGPQPSFVGLLDQITDGEPTGSWNVVVEAVGQPAVRSLIKQSHGMKNEPRDSGQSVRSLIPISASIEAGGKIFVRLTSQKPWKDEGSLVIRLRGTTGKTVSKTIVLKGRNVECLLPVPLTGADGFEVEHLAESNTGLNLNSLVGISVGAEADSIQLARARIFLGWLAEDRSGNASSGCRYRKFPVSSDGCTRSGVALVTGDTLTFDMPTKLSESCFRFWALGLKHGTACQTATLTLEARTRRSWRKVDSWEITNKDISHWRELSVNISAFPRNASAVRFVLLGDSSLLAVCEPMFFRGSSATSKKLNLILIILDTLRAGRLGCYEYTERPTSGRLDSLLEAKGFFLFKKAYSPAPWTLPAISRFLTSRYLNACGAADVPLESETLAEILRANGYYCAGFTGGGILRFAGFEQGFHEYHWPDVAYGKIEHSFPEAKAWMSGEHPTPFFLFLHTYETHMPYTRDVFCEGLPHGRLGDLSVGEPLVPKGFSICTNLSKEESTYVQAAYDGGVRTACDAAAEFLLNLSRSGFWENTVVVILSDHGEEFWDHSTVFAEHSSTSLYDELLHVPFMLYTPNLSNKGIREVESEVSIVDFLPTAVELLGLPFRHAGDGMNLQPLLNSETLERRIPILALDLPEGERWPSKACVLSQEIKYVEPIHSKYWASKEIKKPCWYYPATTELFLLDEDPAERHNRVSEAPELVAQMASLLREGLSLSQKPNLGDTDRTEPRAISASLSKQLRALGYIGAP